jgi:hypothetical protein
LCLHRNFPERGSRDRIDYNRISRRYLPSRSITQLNGFYYNVWKNLASPLAQEFEEVVAAPARAFAAALRGGYWVEFEANVQLVDPEKYR